MNILWDFDGTLFDTYPAYAAIFKEVLDQEVAEEEILSHLKISFTHAIRHFQLTELQLKEIFRREEGLDPEQTPPFADVETVLRAADKNVIMTHKPRKEVLGILRHYRWEELFADIVAGADYYIWAYRDFFQNVAG